MKSNLILWVLFIFLVVISFNSFVLFPISGLFILAVPIFLKFDYRNAIVRVAGLFFLVALGLMIYDCVYTYNILKSYNYDIKIYEIGYPLRVAIFTFLCFSVYCWFVRNSYKTSKANAVLAIVDNLSEKYSFDFDKFFTITISNTEIWPNNDIIPAENKDAFFEILKSKDGSITSNLFDVLFEREYKKYQQKKFNISFQQVNSDCLKQFNDINSLVRLYYQIFKNDASYLSYLAGLAKEYGINIDIDELKYLLTKTSEQEDLAEKVKDLKDKMGE